MFEGDRLDLRLLAPFLAVSEERSFTRAAQRMHLAQPALSQQIKRLETQLGVELFVRSSHGVDLTPAGEQLAVSAYAALEELRRGVARSRALATPGTTDVSVAYVSSLGPDVVPRIARTFAREHPRFQLRLRVMSLDEQLSALRACSVDIGLFRVPDYVDLDLGQMHVVEIGTCRRYAVLPAHHPLAGMAELELSALAGESWIMPSGTYRTNFVAACRSAGFEPHTAQEANVFDAMVGLVRAGLGVCIAVSATDAVEVHGLAAVPLRGKPISLVAGWAGHPEREMLTTFIDVARLAVRGPPNVASP